MEHNPLDLEHHEEETWWDVWKRRVLFFVLIALCITFAAPTFGSCTGAFDVNGQLVARYQVGDRTVEVTDLELSEIRQRMHAAQNFVRGTSTQPGRWGLPMQELTDEVLWQYILTHAAAQEAGIHVPKTEVGRLLMEERPEFIQDGVFNDRFYREAVTSVAGQGASHKDVTRTLQEALQVANYHRLLTRGPLDVFPSEDAFQNWKGDNLRLTVEYVVQPFGPIESEFATKEPEAETLEKFVGDKEEYKLPPAKTIEAAVVRVSDVSDEQLAKLKAFAFEHELVPVEEGEDPEQILGRQLFQRFWQPFTDGSRYTREQWSEVKRLDPAYQAALATYEKLLEEWKAKPVADRGPEPPRDFDDPGANPWKEGLPPGDVMSNYWRDFVAREQLADLVLVHMAERSDEESKSFSELLPEYGALGVRVVVNEKPLTEADLADGFPEDLAKGNEFVNVARTYLKGPVGEATFTPQVHTQTFPLSQYEGRISGAGSIVVRLAAYQKSRKRNFDEVRDEALADWREYQVTTTARDRLAAVETAVTAGGKTLADAAAEAGLRVRSLREFNSGTMKRRPPVLPTDEPIEPRLQELHDSVIYENYVYDRYRQLSAIEPGQFLPGGVQLDSRRTKAAYLLQLAGEREPARIEIDDIALQTQKQIMAYTAVRSEIDGVFGYTALSKRFQLEIDLDKKGAKKKADAEDDTEQAAKEE